MNIALHVTVPYIKYKSYKSLTELTDIPLHEWIFIISRGPMVQGIAPREASDRLQVYQAQFDELWAKFLTYSGGEQLFGLPVTEYPDLQRIKREFTLLQKLYSLYNNVIDSVDGYYDIPWVEVDIEKINQELMDFQNKWVVSGYGYVTQD